MDKEKRVAIFGTGDFGKKAYKYFGEDKVAVFLDNDIEKQGEELFGVHIMSLDEYLPFKDEYELVIAVRDNEAIIRQLIENGFKDFYSYFATSTAGLLHKINIEEWSTSKNEMRRRALVNKRGTDIGTDKWDICLTGWYTELNYGAELTCLALYEYLSSLGYTVLMNQPPLDSRVRPNRFPPLFKKNPYPTYDLSRLFDDIEGMKELNEYVKYFILGSDQLWNVELTSNRGNVSYMEFVDSSKGLLSYSTSFGHAVWNESEDCTTRLKRSLDRYFAISVREESGVSICSEQFGTNAVQCMDPVFLQGEEFYNALAEKSELQVVDNAVSSYYFFKDEIVAEEIEKFARLNNMKVNVIKHVSMFVEDWLKHIKSSQILISHSFHAICFAIIFKVDFVAVEYKWSARLHNLLNMLGIESRIVSNIKEINEKAELLEPIDYRRVYEILNEKVANSKMWLESKLKEMERECVEQR